MSRFIVTMGGDAEFGLQMVVEICDTELEAWKRVIRDGGADDYQVWRVDGDEPVRVYA